MTKYTLPHYTITDAARLLGVTRQRAHAMLKAGLLTRAEGKLPRVANDGKLRAEIRKRQQS